MSQKKLFLDPPGPLKMNVSCGRNLNFHFFSVLKNISNIGSKKAPKIEPKSRKSMSAGQTCFSWFLYIGLQGCVLKFPEFPSHKITKTDPKVGPAGPKAGPTSPKGGPTGPKGGPTGPKGSPTGGKVSESDRFEKSFKAQGLPYM